MGAVSLVDVLDLELKHLGVGRQVDDLVLGALRRAKQLHLLVVFGSKHLIAGELAHRIPGQVDGRDVDRISAEDQVIQGRLWRGGGLAGSISLGGGGILDFVSRGGTGGSVCRGDILNVVSLLRGARIGGQNRLHICRVRGCGFLRGLSCSGGVLDRLCVILGHWNWLRHRWRDDAAALVVVRLLRHRENGLVGECADLAVGRDGLHREDEIFAVHELLEVQAVCGAA